MCEHFSKYDTDHHFVEKKICWQGAVTTNRTVVGLAQVVSFYLGLLLLFLVFPRILFCTFSHPFKQQQVTLLRPDVLLTVVRNYWNSVSSISFEEVIVIVPFENYDIIKIRSFMGFSPVFCFYLGLPNSIDLHFFMGLSHLFKQLVLKQPVYVGIQFLEYLSKTLCVLVKISLINLSKNSTTGRRFLSVTETWQKYSIILNFLLHFV